MSKSTKKVSKEVVTKSESKFNLPKVTIPKVDFKKLVDRYNSDKVVKGIILAIVFLFSFALVDLLVQYLNNSYSVAIVNGVRLTKSQYYDRLEKTYGLTTVKNLIQEELVVQGASKENVTVDAQEVQDRLNEYYNENGGKDAVLATLAANGLTEEDVKGQVRVGLLLEKTLSKQVTYTDKELEDFFKQYQSVIYGTEKVKFADKKEEIKQYYVNKQVGDLKDGWIADLESKAKIQNNVEKQAEYGFLKTTITIVKNLYNEIKMNMSK
jgi:hypothetical protein